MKRAVLRRVLAGYFANDCPLAAAAIAYYVLLSVFPLILLILTIGSLLLPANLVERQVLEFANQYVAGSRATLRTVIKGVGQHSTSLSLLALVGLVWSGMGIFGALRAALNQAYGIRDSRSFWHQRRLEIVFAVIIGGLFLFSSFVTWGIDTVIVPNPHGGRLGLYFLRLAVGAGVAFAGFTLCYEMVPDSRRRTWPSSLKAAGIATVFFEIAKWIFLAWVSGVADYSLVYGTVGAVIVLLVWAYATASILLLGGQLARELDVREMGKVAASNI
ncbi:MAG: YihY/virulence factor BrkB family protein [Chloroflexota bacterium]